MKFSEIRQFTKSPSYNVTVPWSTLEEHLGRYDDRGTLVLEPEFQRAHVWTPEQQSRYVEYILRGGQSSRDIYFNQADWMTTFKKPMYLVDGLQRLTAVRSFLKNGVTVFGQTFESFEGSLHWSVSFTFHVNDLKTYPEVLQWYLDLNFGGTPHTNAERERVEALLAEMLTLYSHD